jgi:DNA polymerase-3 subunit delta
MSGAETKPVYVFHGSDEYLKAERRKELVARLVGQADYQTTVVSFADDAEIADVLDELRTLPFLSPLRVVVISPADDFLKAHRSALEDYVSAPSSSSALVMTVGAWVASWRLAKLVAQAGLAIDCSPPEGRSALVRWIDQASDRHGRKIVRQAAELLADWIGPDLGALDAELEKLAIYVGDRDRIEPGDVGELVTASAGPAAFALSNAITAGDPAAALGALSDSLTARGEEFRVLGQIGWHVRRALQVQQAVGAGESAQQACRQARVGGDRQAFLQMLRRRPLAVLQNDFRKVLRADLDMKTGAEATGTLQTLVVELCR